MSEHAKIPKSKSISLRLPLDVYNIIDDLAKENNVGRSEVIRLALDDALEKYLEHVRYIDTAQANIINKNICNVGNTLVSIVEQLRKYGINLNQIAKKINSGQCIIHVNDESLLSIDAFNQIMERADKSVYEASEVIKCTLE